MPSFVHLHVHSHFSLLDSTIQPKKLAARAAELGMDCVAVTDHASLAACIEFQSACDEAKIRPLFGAVLNVVPDATDPTAGRRPHHLVLLARTLDGYYNLVRLTSKAAMRPPGENGRPLFDRPVNDWSEIESCRGGLIALSGDAGGEIPQLLLRGKADEAVEAAERCRRLFGDDGFYIEITRHPELPETLTLADTLVEFARSVDLPIVATNNVHYLREDHWDAHVVLVAIGMRRVLSRETIQRMPLRSLWLRSPESMKELFEDLPDALANTVRIAEACDCRIPTGSPILPRFPLPDGEDDASWLRRLALEGLDERLAFYTESGVAFERQVYLDRLDRELGVIQDMGFPGYFLIVHDFIKWAHDQGIPVGPGRGSGAGSLVAWVLRITDMDPLPYGLLFERFLNPERVSMPDFDIDFCFHRRLEVVQYVSERYGAERVAQIATYGQLKAKAVLRDVVRVLNRPLAEGDRLAKLVPTKANVAVGLQVALEQEPRLREALQADPDVEYLFRIAKILENVNRNVGVHAAGVVIARDAVAESVPVLRGTGGEYVSAYTGPSVEAAGLVKFDFLGLKTLTVIQDAVALINAERPADDRLDMRRVPLDDRAVFDFFARESTVGIFQMESSGFLRLVRRLRPDRFEDLIALVALYRPGPLQSGMVDDYINVKHGRQAPKYPHPLLEPVLEETYGVMVYQEQVMKSAQVLAGYSLGGADLLRRAMGKKKPSEMEKQRSLFVEGARAHDISEEKALEIFLLIEQFAGYGFNKSHSAVYAILAYHTGWLKTHYPTQFLTALMTSDASSTAKLVAYINDARGRGISVRGPDVNLSAKSFTHGDREIRFGLSAVKGLGDGAIDAILEARADGPFVSLVDFCERIDARRANRSSLDGLTLAGAFDCLHPDAAMDPSPPSVPALGRRRAWLRASLDGALARGQKTRADREVGQSSLFDLFGGTEEPSTTLTPEAGWEPFSVPELLRYEKRLLGNYVSGHPLDAYRDTIERRCDATAMELEDAEQQRSFQLAAVIVSTRILLPRNDGDQRRATVVVEDLTGQIELNISAKRLPEIEPMLDSDAPVVLSGRARVDRDDDGELTRRFYLDEMRPLDALRAATSSQVVLQLTAEFVSTPRDVVRLRDVLDGHPGDCGVVLQWEIGAAQMRASLPMQVRIAPVAECIDAIERIVGSPCVRLR
jgi:DNA polymerase-3 subunit alpha